jgi:hypothetical protein
MKTNLGKTSQGSFPVKQASDSRSRFSCRSQSQCQWSTPINGDYGGDEHLMADQLALNVPGEYISTKS